MIKVLMDYISPTGDLNYEAIDGLAKALYDRYKEAEFEQIVELFKKYIYRRTNMTEGSVIFH